MNNAIDSAVAAFAARRRTILEQTSALASIPGWDTLTPAEISAYCESHHATRKPIGAQDLRNWLADKSLAWFAATGGWKGPLVVLIDNASVPAQVRSGIERLLSHLTSAGSQRVDTHEDDYGNLLAIIAANLQLGAADISSLYALGGGRKYTLITEAEASEQQAALLNLLRVINATALFAERMAPGDDPLTVFAGCWEDSLDT